MGWNEWIFSLFTYRIFISLCYLGCWLHSCRRAERSYSTFKVRRASPEEIPLVKGKEQQLRFAGAAVKRYLMSKVGETQVRW